MSFRRAHLKGLFKYMSTCDNIAPMSSNDPDYRYYLSNHGYHPAKGAKPAFTAFGPDIKDGNVIDGARALD